MHSSNAAHKCNVSGETAMHCYLECGWGPNKPNSLWDDKKGKLLARTSKETFAASGRIWLF
jgi:hypothetical protein